MGDDLLSAVNDQPSEAQEVSSGMDVDALAWMDWETTGLGNPADGRMLEYGIMVTEPVYPFAELWRHHEVVRQPDPTWILQLPPNVVQMHWESGLLVEALTAPEEKRWIGDIDRWLVEQLAPFGRPRHIRLAGSGVGHYDSRWMDAWTPRLVRTLHYRTADCGHLRDAWTLAGMRDEVMAVKGSTFSDDSPQHRAIADVVDHVNEYRWYIGQLRSWAAVDVTLAEVSRQISDAVMTPE